MAVKNLAKSVFRILLAKNGQFLSKPEIIQYFVNFEIIFGRLKNETHGEMTRYPRDVFHLHNISYNIFLILVFQVYVKL